MKKRRKYLLLSVIVLSFISIITSGYSLAKYASNHAWNYYLGTKGFYFSSEELGNEKVINVNNNWEFDKTYFTIKNSENDFLISDFDIEYTVKCTIQNDVSQYSKCTINGTDSDTFKGIISSSSQCKNNIDELDVSTYNKEQCESNGYEWNIQETYKELYFEIIKTGEENLDYVSVLIEVSSTAPYTKTLLGEFNLSGGIIDESGLKINYKEFDNYGRVIISNSYDEDKCVKLDWNSENLRFDETSGKISTYQYDGNNNISEINFNISKKDSISYIFYKTNFTKSYNVQDFTLVEADNC